MWNNLVKRALLTGVCLTSFMWPYEAESAPRSYDNRRTARQTQRSRCQSGRTRNTPRIPAKPRRAEVRPEQKLAHFKRQISRTPNSKMTPEQKRLYIECLDMLASCPRGLWIIQNAPSDLKFEVNKSGTSLNAAYGRSEDGKSDHSISLSVLWLKNIATNTGDNRASELRSAVGTIAHEMTHAIQYHNNILVPPGGSLEDTFTLLKLRELHAHMEEITVCHQLNPRTDHFYGLVVKEKKKEGATQEQAERYARTQFIKKHWENSPSTPLQINGNNIYLPQDVSRFWNTAYNRISYRNILRGPIRQRQNTDLKPAIRKNVALMDIDLKPEFFLSPSQRPFEIEKDKFTAYMDGIKHHELENLEVGTFQKEYLNGQLIISRNLHPKRTSDGEKRQTFKNGYITYTVRNGKMNGPYRQYDAHGRQILEIPMRDNQAHGIGWQRRDGQIHQIEFVNRFSRDFFTRKLNFSSKIRD